MADFKTLDDLPADLTGKVALVRVDLNLPMKDGSATDVTRVEAAKPTSWARSSRSGANPARRIEASRRRPNSVIRSVLGTVTVQTA